MNTFKKFLVLGSALICMTSYNIANSSSQCHSINKSGLISGVIGLSNCDTVITKSLEVQNNDFGKVNHNKLAEVRFGKQNRSEGEPNTNVILTNNGKLIQNKNGHIHVFNHMDVQEGANIFTTKYNPKHIKVEGKKTSIKDFDLKDKNTAGFDIHGDGKDPNSGFVKFHKGSNIKLVRGVKPSKPTNGQGTSSQSSVNSATTTTDQVIGQHNHKPGANNSCTCCSCCCCVETHTGSGSGNGQASGQTSGQGQTSGNTQGQTSGSTASHGTNNLYPALYLCNANSRVDISEVLQETYKPSGSEDEVPQDFKAHIVGTTDENGNRQGTVDIFDLNGSNSGDQTASDSVLGNIDEQLDHMGNNDVICDNVKLNIPSYKIQVVDENGIALGNDSQKIKVTSLEPAVNSGTEEEPVYDTVNGTDKFIGATISLVDEQGNPITEFLPGDLLEILMDNYIDNNNPEYTLLKKKGTEGNGTGIKIVPPISDASDISKIFDTNSNARIINIKFGEEDKRVTIADFIRSIRSSNDNNLKLNVYKESDNNKYMIYNDFLNDPKYTLDLDKFNIIDTVPFKLNPPKDGSQPYIDMDGYNDSDILPLYVNLKGQTNKKLKMPTKNEGEENQINEIDFLGNNTKFNGMIGILENNVDSGSETYVKKLVFDENSYVKTDRITNTTPIDWKFIGSNRAVHQSQNDNCYATNIDNRLSLMTLDKGNKDKLLVKVDDPNKNKSFNGGFNSYIYVDEIFFTNAPDDTNSKKPKTSLVVSDNSTVRLINEQYANEHPESIFGTRDVFITNIDGNCRIQNYDDQLDSVLRYSPVEKFLKATNNLEQQLQFFKHPNTGIVEFHVNIDGANDFPDWNQSTQNSSFLLGIIVKKDENDNKNKMQFYSMMEYVYCPEFNDINTSSSSINLETKPHIYIPLFLKYSCFRYYYVTSFEVFPGYTRDLLKTNFTNAIEKGHKTYYDIIPNIYIGGKQIPVQNSGIQILFNKTNDRVNDGKYLVFLRQNMCQEPTCHEHQP